MENIKNQMQRKVSSLKIAEANNVSPLAAAKTAPPRLKHQHTEVCMSTLGSGEMDITPRKVSRNSRVLYVRGT